MCQAHLDVNSVEAATSGLVFALQLMRKGRGAWESHAALCHIHNLLFQRCVFKAIARLQLLAEPGALCKVAGFVFQCGLVALCTP